MSALEKIREDAPAPERFEELFEELDVPAAVVCARCGESECICEGEPTQSGVVTVVPWERGTDRGAMLRRLWATAHATTFDSEAFFERMPDGPLAPAFRFAIISELVASTVFALTVLPVLVVIAPNWFRHVVVDPAARDLALRIGFLAVPSFALLLVIAHMAHGFALERGARASGASRAPSRALRFGLYATGWDIVLGPIGVVMMLAKGGPAALTKLLDLSVGLPGRASRAFLRGTYRLDGGAAKGALAHAYAVAVVATIIGAILVIAGAVAAALVVG